MTRYKINWRIVRWKTTRLGTQSWAVVVRWEEGKDALLFEYISADNQRANGHWKVGAHFKRIAKYHDAVATVDIVVRSGVLDIHATDWKSDITERRSPDSEHESCGSIHMGHHIVHLSS